MADPVTGIEMVRNAIQARLWAACEDVADRMLRGVKPFRGQVTDGQMVPTDTEGRMVPYFCLVFGGRGRPARGLQGIVTSRQDLKRFVFGIECYGMTIEEADELADRVEDVMEGFEPPNAGEVHSINSGRIENPADVKQNHSRDGIGLLFECYTGTVTPNL